MDNSFLASGWTYQQRKGEVEKIKEDLPRGLETAAILTLNTGQQVAICRTLGQDFWNPGTYHRLASLWNKQMVHIIIKGFCGFFTVYNDHFPWSICINHSLILNWSFGKIHLLLTWKESVQIWAMVSPQYCNVSNRQEKIVCNCPTFMYFALCWYLIFLSATYNLLTSANHFLYH